MDCVLEIDGEEKPALGDTASQAMLGPNPFNRISR